MRKPWIKLMTAGILFSGAAFAADKKEITACFLEVKPAYFRNPAGEIVGAVADYIRAAEEVGDFKVNLTLFPQKRCFESAKNGEVDMVLITGINEERAAYVTASLPITFDAVYYWYNNKKNAPDTMDFKKIDDVIAKGKICARKGFQFAEIEKPIPNIDQGADDLGQLAKKLELGNCNIVIDRFWAVKGIEGISQGKINYSNNPDISSRPMPETRPTIFPMLVSNKSKEKDAILAWMNGRIKELYNSGTVQKIYTKWFTEGVAKDYFKSFEEHYKSALVSH